MLAVNRKNNYVNTTFFLCIVTSLWLCNANAQIAERILNKNWQFYLPIEKQFRHATVPGTIHTDLLANKLIEDPFVAKDLKQFDWIEQQNWEYRTEFFITSTELQNDRILLQFEGLDTYSTIYLNDSLLFSGNNMFVKYTYDVVKKLHKGKNTLRIEFKSAINGAKEEAKKLNYTLPEGERVFVRKAQYNFGWDFAPRLVTCGIWKDVKLVFIKNAYIENIQVQQQEMNKRQATINFKCSIYADVEGIYTLQLYDTAIINQQNISLQKGLNNIDFQLQIIEPQFWWTNGLGKANLYNYEFILQKNNTLIDSKKIKFGLRTIELVQETDEIGKSFYFKLNGEKVFMKGANYVPPDVFLPRIKTDTYKTLVEQAKAANMNMLRVWGGGVYPTDDFFNYCDENGILIWQDFMFACAMYPGDEAFMNSVKTEIIQQIKRLQNHPCLALWCGNNEIDEGWKNWGWQKQFKYSKIDSITIWKNYDQLFQQLIPQLLKEQYNYKSNTSTFNYWPSSPSIGWGRKESLTQGDAHYWGVWWGLEPFKIYEKKVGRFMSEYGFQGMPNEKLFRTIKAMIYTPNSITKSDNSFDSNSPNIDSTLLKTHQRHPTGFETIKTYMQSSFPQPNNLNEYIYYSQLLQAEGLKLAMEAHRRKKPYCMGTLFWQFNDCWPAISWSAIDYYGKPKALYYQAKESFKDVLISFEHHEKITDVFIINDKLTLVKGMLHISIIDFYGKVLWQDSTSLELKPNESKSAFIFNKEVLKNLDTNAILLQANLMHNNTSLIQGHTYFTVPKNLNLPAPQITITKVTDNEFQLNSATLLKNVHSDAVHLQNDYQDLLPQQTLLIKQNVSWLNATNFNQYFTTLNEIGK
jgi:beta-mannosidase